jgi:hypothetical protein
MSASRVFAVMVFGLLGLGMQREGIAEESGIALSDLQKKRGIKLPNGLQMQGLQMQGGTLRGIAIGSLRLHGQRVQEVRLTGAELRGRVAGRELSGAALAGARLTGVTAQGQRVRLAIRRATPDPADPSGETWLYDLWRHDGRRWVPACRPDAEGVRLALPLLGTWDATGTHRVESGRFTFACVSGVLAKCVRWGYRPWRSAGDRALADYHQACTRLARADYCGDGTPHTREGTLISLYDDLGIQERDGDDGMSFEAAWTPRGAACIRRDRLGLLPAAVLLSCLDRVSLPSLRELLQEDGCALRLHHEGASVALISNRSLARW